MAHQRYVSNELTHFVGGGLKSHEERFNLLATILKTGVLHTQPSMVDGPVCFTWGFPISVDADEMFSAYCVCFCDIPLADLGIHIGKYGPFGIAFTKGFLVGKGASPVFYIAKDALSQGKYPAGRRFEELLTLATKVTNNGRGRGDPRDLWTLMEWHLLTYLKPFDSQLVEEHKKNYYMEREWRVIGGFRFQVDDVARVIIPREFARKFREVMPEYIGQISFPSED